MSEVTSFDDERVRKVLATCPKIIQVYVKLLNAHMEKRMEMVHHAISQSRKRIITINGLRDRVLELEQENEKLKKSSWQEIEKKDVCDCDIPSWDMAMSRCFKCNGVNSKKS